MVLDIRQKQTAGVQHMLQFNAAANTLRKDEEIYKVLVVDRFTKGIIGPLLKLSDLRKQGVTLVLDLENQREAIPDVPAIYFVQATVSTIAAISRDVAAGLYDTFHLNLALTCPRPLLETLASNTVAAQCVQRIAKIYDQYMSFIALEAGLFSLGISDTYLQLNDPQAQDTQIEGAVESIVNGLFSALVTLGTVPVIKCPKGGAAQHVATALDARLREHLKSRSNLFTESSSGLTISRPLLCLFDRNFELSVMLQHVWTYKPLVHDVLGMQANSVTIDTKAEAGQLPGTTSKKRYESNGTLQFPEMAGNVDVQLKQYTDSNTRNLMSAISSLPQLTERKKVIDKHTNMATCLLKQIQARALKQYWDREEDCLHGKPDLPAIERLLQGSEGSAMDKLRLVLVWLLTTEALPSDSDMERLQSSLASAGADTTAVAYLRRMRSMKLTGGGVRGSASSIALDGLASAGLGPQSHLLSWADRAFGPGLTTITKGVKSLLAGNQQAAVTVAVEGLMDAKANAEADSFITFDPKVVSGRASKAVGPFKEAVVFMIGGGNYLEYESLSLYASKSQPPKNILYGATDIISPEAFAKQLADLGKRAGGL
ncbi:MAG: SM Sec1-family [Trebouxia sp. A1-2]|nr:MAG: SM Sec1-family [Trebouxia sp. A1-2]